MLYCQKILVLSFIVVTLLLSACVDDSTNETTTMTKTSLDTEIKRSNHTGKYHHVEGCATCHDITGNSINIALINTVIDTPSNGPKTVRFTARTGPYSFADGDATYDGVCEVCHTQNKHHNNDGQDNTAHMDGTACTTCHLHDKQFAAPPMPYTQSHQTHLQARHVNGMNVTCTTCHNYPISAPLVFADLLPLATTTVCDTCHSPGGTYPGTDGLLNAALGAKANFKTGGIYEADGLTLKAGKEKWCTTCHDESPSVINSMTASITNIGASTGYHYVAGCQTCHDVSGDSSNTKLVNTIIRTPNSGSKNIVFTAQTGSKSFADGDATYDGVCEACHTLNRHHNDDGHDNTAHFDGIACTTCHLHSKQFATPHPESHRRHLYLHSSVSTVCTTCHNDPLADPLIFADMQPLATTTVCDTCHGGNLLDPIAGAKANFINGGVYEKDMVTLKAGKEWVWCRTCHVI